MVFVQLYMISKIKQKNSAKKFCYFLLTIRHAIETPNSHEELKLASKVTACLLVLIEILLLPTLPLL